METPLMSQVAYSIKSKNPLSFKDEEQSDKSLHDVPKVQIVCQVCALKSILTDEK